MLRTQRSMQAADSRGRPEALSSRFHKLLSTGLTALLLACGAGPATAVQTVVVP